MSQRCLLRFHFRLKEEYLCKVYNKDTGLPRVSCPNCPLYPDIDDEMCGAVDCSCRTSFCILCRCTVNPLLKYDGVVELVRPYHTWLLCDVFTARRKNIPCSRTVCALERHTRVRRRATQRILMTTRTFTSATATRG